MCGAVVVRHRPFSCFCVTEQHPARVWRVALNIPACRCQYRLPRYRFTSFMVMPVADYGKDCIMGCDESSYVVSQAS